MASQLRKIAKRLLPVALHGGIFKEIWERIKRSRDKDELHKWYPDVPFVYLSPAEIKAHRDDGYQGQFCQDLFLDVLFPKTDGRFIDIGANSPTANSNTYQFEKKGWSGYAFDPMRSLKERWAVRPRTQFINAGISDQLETRAFVEIIPRVGWEHQLSSFREFVREEDIRDYDFLEYPVECAPISSLVTAGENIDFASIDVEGAEALILRGFDFEDNPPVAILVENVSKIGGENTLREYLERRGYDFTARLNASDDLFIQESYIRPQPFIDRVGMHSL